MQAVLTAISLTNGSKKGTGEFYATVEFQYSVQKKDFEGPQRQVKNIGQFVQDGMIFFKGNPIGYDVIKQSSLKTKLPCSVTLVLESNGVDGNGNILQRIVDLKFPQDIKAVA